ncbi:hypothetical protein J3A83DRAFT_4383156 [Scleroderma citrinum]
MANIHIESLCLQEALRNCTLNHTNDQNLQTVFKAFKEKVIAIIRNRAKKIIPMTWNRIDNLQDKLQETLNDNTILDDDRLLSSTDLQEQINTLRQSLHNSTHDHSHLKIRVESISPTSKLWAQSGKERKPRDSIAKLMSPGSAPHNPSYINHSNEMAELACNYYENLQSKDLAPPDVCQRVTDKVLNAVSISLPNEEHMRLDQDFTLEEVQSTLKGLPSGKVAGLDGLPYEFLKWLESTPAIDNRHNSFNYLTVSIKYLLIYNTMELTPPQTSLRDGYTPSTRKKISVTLPTTAQ